MKKVPTSQCSSKRKKREEIPLCPRNGSPQIQHQSSLGLVQNTPKNEENNILKYQLKNQREKRDTRRERELTFVTMERNQREGEEREKESSESERIRNK